MKTILMSASVVALAAVVVSAPAYAGHARAGLWKLTNTSRMTPGDTSDSSNTGNFCRTADEAAHDAPQVVGRDCTQKNIKWNGNSVSGDTVCAGPVPGNGKFTQTFANDTHYSGTYVFNGSSMMTGSFKLTQSSKAEWLGANCGDTKPLE